MKLLIVIGVLVTIASAKPYINIDNAGVIEFQLNNDGNTELISSDAVSAAEGTISSDSSDSNQQTDFTMDSLANPDQGSIFDLESITTGTRNQELEQLDSGINTNINSLEKPLAIRPRWSIFQGQLASQSPANVINPQSIANNVVSNAQQAGANLVVSIEQISSEIAAQVQQIASGILTNAQQVGGQLASNAQLLGTGFVQEAQKYIPGSGFLFPQFVSNAINQKPVESQKPDNELPSSIPQLGDLIPFSEQQATAPLANIAASIENTLQSLIPSTQSD